MSFRIGNTMVAAGLSLTMALSLWVGAGVAYADDSIVIESVETVEEKPEAGEMLGLEDVVDVQNEEEVLEKGAIEPDDLSSGQENKLTVQDATYATFELSIGLADNVKMYYYVKPESGYAAGDFTITSVIAKAPAADGLAESTPQDDVTVVDGKLTDVGTNVGDGKYRVMVADCFAMQMNTNVTVTVTYKNGDSDPVVVKSQVYTVEDYCKEIIDDASNGDGLKAMCRSVLTYGKYAGVLDSRYTPVSLSGSKYIDTLGSVSNPGTAKKSGTNTPIQKVLSSLRTSSSLEFNITLLREKVPLTSALYIKSHGVGETELLLPGDYVMYYQETDRLRYVFGRIDKDGLLLQPYRKGDYDGSLYSLDDVFIVEVGTTDTAYPGKLHYEISPLDYLYSLSNNADSGQANLAKALYQYHLVSKDYWNSQQP